MRFLTDILLTLLTIVIPVVSLKFLILPFVWILSSWAGACIVLAFRFSRPLTRSVFVNLAAALIALMLAEVYEAYSLLETHGPTRLEQVHVTNPHPVLGYVASSNTKRMARKVNNRTGEVIYEHQVTIGENGLRITLPFNSRSKKAIIFFGGSFTYGEGVGDDETLPAQVAQLTKGRYRVYNFALHGYGPQHMLAALEHGLVGGIVQPVVRFVFYVTIKDHVRRLEGNKLYLRTGPRYVLSDRGEAVSSGSFHQPGSAWATFGERLKTQLMKSYLLMRVWFNRVDESDLRLYVAAVKRAAKLVGEKYPSAEFHVLYWNISADKDKLNIADRLRPEGISVYEIIATEYPGFQDDPAKYQIAGDGHPTANAYRIVAEKVVRRFIETTENQSN